MTESAELEQFYPSESSEYQSAESQISSPVSEWVSIHERKLKIPLLSKGPLTYGPT